MTNNDAAPRHAAGAGRRLLLAAAVAVGTACAGASVHVGSSSLPPALASSITRTLGVTSIEADESVEVAAGVTTTPPSPESIRLIYQAPDRLEMLDGAHTIRIGSSTYAYLSPAGLLNPPGQPPMSVIGAPPPRWTETTQPKQTVTTIRAMIFGPLHTIERAQTISGGGPTYSFRLHEKTAQGTLHDSGTVTVSDGWVSSVTLDSTASRVIQTFPGGATAPTVEHVTQRITYTHYNNAPAINPPPASEVTIRPPSGGVPITAAAAPVHLPNPTVKGASPLQFRPVESVTPGPCHGTAPASSPAADQPATLPDVKAESCYQLAPAQMTIIKVAHAEVNNDRTGEQAVMITLEDADATAFDRHVAAVDYHKKVAIVMFGRVLSAPTIAATHYNRQASISGLDPQTEANVIAALTR